MSFTLQVTPTADAEATKTLVFDKEVVIIGRDPSADLTLEDSARIVSNRHAEIRQEGGSLSLADLGSKNGTIHNGRRLRSEDVAQLGVADLFEVGDFEIQVVEILERTEAPIGKEAVVVPANGQSHEASLETITQSEKEWEPTAGSQADAEGTRKEAAGYSDLNTSASKKGDTNERQAKASEVPDPDPGESAVANDQVVEELVAAVSKLASIPWQFRHEFIGQTIAPPEEEAVFADGSPKALRRYLLDPRIDADERAARLSALSIAAESGVLHQVAMLDGYKAAIAEGTKHLLETLDPEQALTNVKQRGFWNRLPLFRSVAALRHIRQSFHDVAQEDEAAVERGRFRSAFINAYLARMTRRSDSQVEDS